MELDRSPGTRHDISANPELAPVIWPFRVKWIEFVGPERLEEWHRVMREQVGVQIHPDAEGGPGCATISGCSGGGWDDSDWWGPGCSL
jgi:hypothetical protein